MPTTVMTGGTSGFGAIAAARLRRADHRVLLGSRSPTTEEELPLDLASLDSVRAFADDVGRRLPASGIDALVLNAGLVRPDDEGRTVDGVETTFAVNLLAHALLVRRLLPVLADGCVVVLTTSGTHDPETGASLRPPRHADAELLARPEGDPERDQPPRRAGQHAYTASKLCVVLLARALCRRAEIVDRRVRVVAYDPGQVFGTGLARELALPLRVAWRVFGTRLLGWPVRRASPTLNTPTAAGDALADLVLGRVAAPPRTAPPEYAALRRGRLAWTEPSVLARRDDLAEALWADSVRMAP